MGSDCPVKPARTRRIILRPWNYWLMKSEPDDVSVDDALAAPNATVPWTGVRGWQARNFMREADARGRRRALLSLQLRTAGHRRHRTRGFRAYPDPTQFEPKSRYYDPASKPEKPRWVLVEVQVLRKTRNLTLPEMRANPDLAEMLVLKKRKPAVHHACGATALGGDLEPARGVVSAGALAH